MSAPVTLACPSHGRAWTVSPARDGSFVQLMRTDGLDHADLEASPEALLLALWHRIGLDDPRVHIAGNGDQVRALFDGPLTA